MIIININPVLFSLGPLTIRWYGLMYAVGITVGLLVTWPFAKTRGFTKDQMEKIVFWSIPAGLVGARLYFVMQQPMETYLREPWRILAFWEGGMAFYGAIFAVVITLLVLARRWKLSIWNLLDLTPLFAVVGQFFGRIGNFINGDVIGYSTNLPWGVIYANPDSFAPRHDIAYQPAAVYEGIIDLILFALLWFLRNRVKPGILFFIYIFGYSLSQIVVFIWRDNEIVLFGLKQAQLTAAGVIIASAIIFVWFLKRQRADKTKVQLTGDQSV
jgi:phosphatidylglycerol---prolipoprotein diacylglyceryl transferase